MTGPTATGPHCGRLLTVAERTDRMANEISSAIPNEILRSAFAISDRYLLTAWHCIEQEFLDGCELWYRLRDPSARKRSYLYIPVRLTNYDQAFDIAVLTIDLQRLHEAELTESAASEIFGTVVIALGANVVADDRVHVLGYPEGAPSTDSDINTAKVIDVVDTGDVRGLKLAMPALAAVSPINPHGMSGGPVLKDGPSGDPAYTAVGVVRSVPMGYSWGLAAGGAIIATRIADVADRLPEVGVTMIADPQARIAPSILGLTKNTNAATVMEQCARMLSRMVVKIDDDLLGELTGWSHFFDESPADRSPTAIGTAYGLKLSMATGDQQFGLDRATLTATLWRLRQPDGGWAARTGQGISRPEVTALVVGALAATGDHSASMADAVAALERETIASRDQEGMKRTYIVSAAMRGLMRARPNSPRLPELREALLAGAIKDQVHKSLSCWSSQLSTDDQETLEPSSAHTALALVALLRAEKAIGEDVQAQEFINQGLKWLSLTRNLTNQHETIRRSVAKRSQVASPVRHFTSAWVARALLLASPEDIPEADSLLNEAVRLVWQRYFNDRWEWDGEIPKQPIWMTYQGVCVLRDYALRTSVPL
jgi:hypothetical protein